jgi:hypothetical protein
MSDEVQNASSGSPGEGHEGGEGSFNWEDGVQDKALLENPTVANLKGKPMDEILKTHIDAQSFIGKSVQVPELDAPSEEWGKFYDKVRPADINEYKVEYPESKFADPDTKSWFIQNSHELGLTQQQASSLAQKHVEYVEQQMTSLDEQAEKIIADKIAANKKELGPDYDKTMNLFERTIKTEGGDTLWEALQENPLVDDLNFIKLIANYGNTLGEDKLVKGEGSSSMNTRSVEEIKKEIAELRESDAYKAGPMAGDKYTHVRNQLETKYQELVKVRDG